MITERKRPSVPPRLLAADGTANGLLTVSSIDGLFVKQKITLRSNTKQPVSLEIKRFISPTQFYVGIPGDINQRFVGANQYLTIDNASIEADEQSRPGISFEDRDRATYMEEPIMARRNILVDKDGEFYSDDNPLPVNASVSIGDVNVDLDFDPNDPDGPDSSNTGAYLRDAAGNLITSTADGGKQRLDVDIGGASISIDLDGFDPTNPDSVTTVGSEDGTKTGVKHALRVDSELDLRVGISDGANKAAVSADGKLSVQDADAATILASIDAGTPDSLGQKTMANSQPVVIASDQSDVPVSVGSLPLPTGASTEAKQDDQITQLASIDNSLISIDAGIPAALGETTKANSMPVVLPSDQVVPVSAANLPLPSGAATEVKQDAGNASLASIDAGVPAALGQTNMANSMPVVLPSDQTVNVAAAALPLPSGAATSALQNTGNTSLSSIDSKLSTTNASLASIDAGIPAALGQQVMADSMPVVLASNQSPIPVTASLADEPIKISGTENGLPNGTERTFVNNLRLQVLASADRLESYTYADFGTKDQRITRVDYTSATFPGVTIRRDFNYVLDGNRYRRTTSPWSVV